MRRAAAVVAVAVLLGGCGGSDRPLLVDRDEVDLGGVTALRIRYRTVDGRGHVTVVGALVAVPDGEPPDGGWPVVAYAHGTTGSAPGCAPSQDPSLAGVATAIGTLMGAGYAVVATDYVGVGTSEPHPYLHGRSEARAVFDSVRALREIEPEVGERWAVVGYSQGGHAALWTGALADGELVGVVSQAGSFDPASLAEHGGPGVEALLAAGWLAVDGDVDADADAVLTDEGRRAVEASEDECQVVTAGPIVTGAGRAAFDEYLAANVAGARSVPVPVLVVQGSRDQLVPPEVADAAVGRLCRAGTVVEAGSYVADHLTITQQSAGDVLAWLADRFADRPAPSSC